MEKSTERRSIAEVLRHKSDLRRAALKPRIDHLITQLSEKGVRCEIVGSYARKLAIFDSGSDVDILIESHNGLSEGDVWGIAWALLYGVNVDLIFGEYLSPKTIALMKDFAHG